MSATYHAESKSSSVKKSLESEECSRRKAQNGEANFFHEKDKIVTITASDFVREQLTTKNVFCVTMLEKIL